MTLTPVFAALLPLLPFEPTVDGRFDPVEWQGAVVCTNEDLHAVLHFARTACNFCVAMSFDHTRQDAKADTPMEHDDEVYKNDNIEMFVSLPGCREMRHVIADTRGAIYDESIDIYSKADPTWDTAAVARGSYDPAARRCYIEMTVPMACFTPNEGSLTFSMACMPEWCRRLTTFFGKNFRPETFTAFEIGRTFPLTVVEAEVSRFAGLQPALFRIRNGGKVPVHLTGTFEGRSVILDLDIGETGTVKTFTVAKEGERKRLHLRLVDSDGVEQVSWMSTFVAKPLMKVSLLSDIVWGDEPVVVNVLANEKKSESVRVEVSPNVVFCRYQDEVKTLPYHRISSPWQSE